MIDLTAKKLPDSLIVGGKPYKVLTDFRIWLRLNEILQDDFTLLDTSFIFDGEMPEEDWSEPMIEFLQSPNVTPKADPSDVQLYDFFADGDYIYGSFLQAYGIDLTEIDLHWHKFMALFASLPDETKMARIISYRAYKRSSKTPEETMEGLRRAWALPEKEIGDDEFLEWANEEFR